MLKNDAAATRTCYLQLDFWGLPQTNNNMNKNKLATTTSDLKYNENLLN